MVNFPSKSSTYQYICKARTVYSLFIKFFIHNFGRIYSYEVLYLYLTNKI